MCQPAHQEQFGVQCLVKGHFDMQTRGIKTLALPLSCSCPQEQQVNNNKAHDTNNYDARLFGKILFLIAILISFRILL